MLKIYGHFLSMPANKVRLCVSYLGLPHEYTTVDLMGGEHQGAEFLKINPAGRVPAMDDDGFILSQSDAICKYMCALSGPSKFYPEDIQEQAKVNQWINFSSQHIIHAMSRVFFNRVVAPMIKENVDENSLNTGLTMLGRDLAVVEETLNTHAYLTNDHITLADITLISGLEPAEMCKFDLSEYPAISKWRAGIMEQEFYKKVHPHFAAEMTASG